MSRALPARYRRWIGGQGVPSPWYDGSKQGVHQPFPHTDAQTFIQWKGTQVCMDFYCPCDPNEPRHVDAMFAYFVRCPACAAVYEVGTQVKMRRLADGEDPAGRVIDAEPEEPEWQPKPDAPPVQVRWYGDFVEAARAAGAIIIGPEDFPALEAGGFITLPNPPGEQTGFPRDMPS